MQISVSENLSWPIKKEVHYKITFSQAKVIFHLFYFLDNIQYIWFRMEKSRKPQFWYMKNP
jgi:hypothetical protein